MSDTDYTPCQGEHDEPCSDPECYVYNARKIAERSLEYVEKAKATKPCIVITEVPIDLSKGNVVEMKMRAPAIVVAAGFQLKTPAVLGASVGMRSVEKVEVPILFVHCDPRGELVDRVFAFVGTDQPFVAADGFTAAHVVTGIGPKGAMHVLEVCGVS